MSKEQPYSRESGPIGAPSSKNAKDKRNSTMLLAISETKHGDGSNRRGSSCSSEKDSGYSDGSDWQQTDVEDQRTTKSRPRETEQAEAPQAGQAKVPGSTNTGMPTRLAQPPFYIIKPATTQKTSQLCVANSVTISNRTVSPHMIILEQPSLVPAAFQLLQPSRAAEKKANSTYLPILNSYPRIAPHPTNKPPERSSSNQEPQSLSKRLCTERKTEDASVARGLSEERQHKQPKLTDPNSVLLSSASSRNGLFSSTFTISSTNPGSPSTSSPHTAPSDPSVRGSHRRITPSSHHRRFLNTVELLRGSGLLDITLRTKELLRQSNRTEQDISQLRRHTELLCQAVSSSGQSPNGVAAWERLCQAMAESGCYPNLKNTQPSQNPSHLEPISQTQSISSGNMNIQQAAEGSCSSEQAQVKPDEKLETREGDQDKVTLMSPDSSTG